MASVTVCGSARANVSPDRATLDLGLTRVAASATEAMRTVADRSLVLEDQLASLGFSQSDWSTQAVMLAEEWEWKNDSNTLVGHRATAGLTLSITALHRIGDVIRLAVDQVGAQIRNLQWYVAADHAMRYNLLGLAALDARRRAVAYAEALGLQLGLVEEVSEIAPGPAHDSGPQARAFLAKAADSEASMNISGGEIALEASVFVRFATLAQP